jgi:ParB family chromosome partitioning protein
MKVIQLKISEVSPYVKNSRKHPEEQVKLIAKSITDFGFNQPILLDEENVIIAGHGRFLAAQSLGLDEVPVCYPARKLTEQEIKALRILDNKLQNDSHWDYESLEQEFEFLENNNFSLEDWGLEDLKKWFKSDQEYENSEIDTDTFPDLLSLTFQVTPIQKNMITDKLKAINSDLTQALLQALKLNV